MRRVADAKTVVAESRVSVLVDRSINVAVIEVVVREVPVSLIESSSRYVSQAESDEKLTAG
jgi:hypothetical protein